MHRKEAGEMSKVMVNAVAHIMRERNIDEKDATKYLEEYVSHLEDKFVDAVGKAKARYSGEDLKILERYASGLQMVCAGNFVWSTVCGRYNRFA